MCECDRWRLSPATSLQRLALASCKSDWLKLIAARVNSLPRLWRGRVSCRVNRSWSRILHFSCCASHGVLECLRWMWTRKIITAITGRCSGDGGETRARTGSTVCRRPGSTSRRSGRATTDAVTRSSASAATDWRRRVVPTVTRQRWVG